MCKYLGHLPSSAWREPAHFQRISPRHELDRVRYSAMLEYDAKAPGILHSEKVSTRGCVAGTANQTLRRDATLRSYAPFRQQCARSPRSSVGAK